MSAIQCSVCMENYNSQLNPPYTCNPCGHVFCKVCIENWRRSHQTCPTCRGQVLNIIQNRDLLEVIESGNTVSTDPLPGNDGGGISIEFNPMLINLINPMLMNLVI